MIKSKQMQQRCNSTKGWCRSCSYAPRRNSHSLILTAKGYTYTKQSNPLVQKLTNTKFQARTLHNGGKQGIYRQIGIRFHVKSRIHSPEICKQSLRVKSRKAKASLLLL